MLLACAYVFLIRAETWSARQSLIVRDDLLGQSYKPGRFDSLDSMKTAQETILEISRRPQVIRNALEKLGPESNGFLGMGKSNWPSEEVIEVVQGAISFSAPLSLIHISEPTRPERISYAVFCLKKKK